MGWALRFLLTPPFCDAAVLQNLTKSSQSGAEVSSTEAVGTVVLMYLFGALKYLIYDMSKAPIKNA